MKDVLITYDYIINKYSFKQKNNSLFVAKIQNISIHLFLIPSNSYLIINNNKYYVKYYYEIDNLIQKFIYKQLRKEKMKNIL